MSDYTQLPAEAFRPGDAVIGWAEGTSAAGVVAEGHPHPLGRDEDVLVRWSDIEGGPYLVASASLRLWPMDAHQARVAEFEASNR